MGRGFRRTANGLDQAEAATLRAVVEALRSAVLVLDQGDRVVMANPAASDMGLVRRPPDTAADEVQLTLRTLAGQVRRTGRSKDVEMELPRPPSGRVGPGEPLGVRVRASQLDGGRVAIEAADATEAHRVARVRRDFVANVSHELKTPVGALRLLAEALLHATAQDEPARDPPGGPSATVGSGPDPGAARRFAERILAESTRLGKLVSELLELSRLQGAEPLPEPERVPLDRVVSEVVDRTRTAAAAKDISVSVEGARGLVAGGSESQLVSAVVNLVENAVAYSPEGTEVTIVTRAGPDSVEIAVVDRGIGVEPRDLPRIFERFYRADRARSRATGGTGLGLAIVKHIATNHAGRVDVVSTVGQGSTFTLRLPARVPAALPLPGWAGPEPEPAGVGDPGAPDGRERT